ncbi:MAG: M14 family zinc carboxypeptidase [Planctomycetota bacterium]|nr:M14 family zinc carboxypeptidase [Planctomycetota bacterium]
MRIFTRTLAAATAAAALLPACRVTAATLGAMAAGRAPRWETIGSSREGRPVRAVTSGRGGPRVALVAGIHGDEQEGLRHLDEIVGLVQGVPRTVRLIADANPDGTAASTRTTAAGVDPNRNWPAGNFRAGPRHGPRPLSEPAVAAVHRDLVEFDPDLVIVLHAARSGPFVNFDGPARGHAEAFRDGAGSPWRVRPSMGYPTPGSLGTWAGVDRGIPILTIEFARGAPREETGPPLLAGLEAVLVGPTAEPDQGEFYVR